MRERLDIDWTTYLQTDHDDIEEMWGKFILMFNQAEKEFIPKKIVKTGKRKFNHRIDKKNSVQTQEEVQTLEKVFRAAECQGVRRILSM